MAKTGITRLLIASAIDADVYRRLIESSDETFDEFDVAEEHRELLRHPDHRLLPLLGAALAEDNAPASPPASASASVVTMAAPAAVVGTPPGMPRTSAPLPDMSLVLTLVPCAIYDGEELRTFSFATWVNPLPDGTDPDSLPLPADVVLPGKPLPPLRAVVRVSAIQLQDAAGHPLVGLSASLLRSTNMFAPPPAAAAGNPAAIGRDLSASEVQTAIAAVRSANAEARYGKLVDLLRVLHPEGTA